ncbi:peptidase M15, partial [Candidatus Pacearchaeota archaeon]|nr:peptidase M15 [Candidatus Pacearchaeota archaeon]
MNLSKNFTLDELIVTSTSGSNIPPGIHKEKLLYVANYLAQPIRDRWGVVIVNSGYRSEAVNAAIGGSKTSQHPRGEAIDIRTPDADLWEVYLWILDNLNFGQCIFEEKGSATWIHISLPRLAKPNKQALLFKDGEYSTYGE